MYRKILVTLENSRTDESIIRHVCELAQKLESEVLLLHVADGWVARSYHELNLTASPEMREDYDYLEAVRARFESHGIVADTLLLLGEPADEIIKIARRKDVDLIAMSTHGHRFISDLIYGSTADKVRHLVDIPVLLLKAPSA